MAPPSRKGSARGRPRRHLTDGTSVHYPLTKLYAYRELNDYLLEATVLYTVVRPRPPPPDPVAASFTSSGPAPPNDRSDLSVRVLWDPRKVPGGWGEGGTPTHPQMQPHPNPDFCIALHVVSVSMINPVSVPTPPQFFPSIFCVWVCVQKVHTRIKAPSQSYYPTPLNSH